MLASTVGMANELDGPRTPRHPASPLAAQFDKVYPFSLAPAAARVRFAAIARRVPMKHGERAWRMGDPGWAFAFVSKGIVKIVRQRPGGRSDILGIFGPGEAIGTIAAVRGSPYPADAVAVTAHAEIVQIPRAEVLAVAHEDAAFATALAEGCANRAAGLRDMTAVLSAGSVETRLAALVCEIAERFGDEDEDGTLRVPVALSRGDLAAFVATSTETAIRTLSRWAKDGLVSSYEGGLLVHDPAKLRAIAARAPTAA